MTRWNPALYHANRLHSLRKDFKEAYYASGGNSTMTKKALRDRWGRHYTRWIRLLIEEAK